MKLYVGTAAFRPWGSTFMKKLWLVFAFVLLVPLCAPPLLPQLIEHPPGTTLSTLGTCSAARNGFIRKVTDGDAVDDCNPTGTGLFTVLCQCQQTSPGVYEWAAVGGVSSFLSLLDTPSSYAGSGGQALAVNVGATAVEFTPFPDEVEDCSLDTVPFYGGANTLVCTDPDNAYIARDSANGPLRLRGDQARATLDLDQTLTQLAVSDGAGSVSRVDMTPSSIAFLGGPGSLTLGSFSTSPTKFTLFGDLTLSGGFLTIPGSATTSVLDAIVFSGTVGMKIATVRTGGADQLQLFFQGAGSAYSTWDQNFLKFTRVANSAAIKMGFSPSATEPIYVFVNDEDTGLSRAAADDGRLVAGASSVASFSRSGGNNTFSVFGQSLSTSQATGTTPLIARGAAGQTADLLKVQVSGPTDVVTVSSTGTLTIAPTSGNRLFVDGTTLDTTVDAAGRWGVGISPSAAYDLWVNGDTRINQVLVMNGVNDTTGGSATGLATLSSAFSVFKGAGDNITGTINLRPGGDNYSFESALSTQRGTADAVCAGSGNPFPCCTGAGAGTCRFNTTTITGSISSAQSEPVAIARLGNSNATGAIFKAQSAASADLWTINPTGMVIDAAQSVTCADSGDGNPGAVTITPTRNYLEFTNADANGCSVTMSETGMVEGMRIEIVVVSNAGGTINFADSAGVSELAGAFAADIDDSLTLRYTGTTWVESSRSAN